jgi:hypothetical protein
MPPFLDDFGVGDRHDDTPREFELYSQLYIRSADDATPDILATRAGAGDRLDG